MIESSLRFNLHDGHFSFKLLSYQQNSSTVRGVACLAKGLQSAHGTFEFRIAGAGGLEVSLVDFSLVQCSEFSMVLVLRLLMCLFFDYFCCWQHVSCCLLSLFMLLFSVTYQILHSGNLDGNGKACLLNMFFFSNVMF